MERTASNMKLIGLQHHRCGYCLSEDTAYDYLTQSEALRPSDLDGLIQLGWERCGTLVTKNVSYGTCCPHYSIRLRANEVQYSKSQRKVWKKLRAFLEEDVVVNDTIATISELGTTTSTAADSVPTATASPLECNSSNGMYSTRKNVLTVDMELASFSTEKLDLFQRYEMAVHKRSRFEASAHSFIRFGVKSPMDGFLPVDGLKAPQRIWTSGIDSSTLSTSCGSETFPYSFGTYHQLYRLNGKLIAVGILDILPTGICSLYLFYDTDYRHLSIGKFTAMKEIEFCRRYGFQYYYLGSYVHSCTKMRYKADFQPSDLLCPTTLQWFPYKECCPHLERFHFSPFEPVLAAQRASIDLFKFEGCVERTRKTNAKTNSDASIVIESTELDSTDKVYDYGGGCCSSPVETQKLKRRYLAQFAPGNYASHIAPYLDEVGRVPMAIGHAEKRLLPDLAPSIRSHTEETLREWLRQTGELGTTIEVYPFSAIT